MKLKLLKYAIIKTLPIMAGYVVLGIGFGILMELEGFGVFWTLIMSLFIYAGSMQYVGISLLSSKASYLSIAMTTLMVNARHLFYGISMIERYKDTGRTKPYLMMALTDETYSLVCTGDCPSWAKPQDYYFLVSLCNHIYWVTGSVLGALVGSMLSFDTKGIDFAMTAFFVTVFVEQWLSTKEHRPALVGVGISLICLVLFGSNSFLIPAMIFITFILMALHKPLTKGESSGE